MCVQNLNDSRGLAIRITYRISLRSSSLWEPRHPPLKVVLHFLPLATAGDTTHKTNIGSSHTHSRPLVISQIIHAHKLLSFSYDSSYQHSLLAKRHAGHQPHQPLTHSPSEFSRIATEFSQAKPSPATLATTSRTAKPRHVLWRVSA